MERLETEYERWRKENRAGRIASLLSILTFYTSINEIVYLLIAFVVRSGHLIES